jgi:hypothetical protein
MDRAARGDDGAARRILDQRMQANSSGAPDCGSGAGGAGGASGNSSVQNGTVNPQTILTPSQISALGEIPLTFECPLSMELMNDPVQTVDGQTYAQCSGLIRNVHSRMLLDPTPAGVKLLQACDQWHSSRVSTFLPVDTVNYTATLMNTCALRLRSKPSNLELWHHVDDVTTLKERSYIETWFATGHKNSPSTGALLHGALPHITANSP